MSKKNNPDWYTQLNQGDIPEVKHIQPIRQTKQIKKTPVPAAAELIAQSDQMAEYNFTYQATRHERQWLLQSLGAFYEHRWIEDVLRMVKGGKEATVYLCQSNPQITTGLAAAKVYRPRMLRNLRKDHIYREGRTNLDADGHVIKDDKTLHAMQKKTSYGKELMHTSWLEHEFAILNTLSAAGVDVPKPYANESNALLIGYVGDEQSAAPALHAVRLGRGEAREIFQRLLKNVELMLANNIIHGDLSAYNVLYWDGEVTIIDFPQAISPEQNPSAFRIFERDLVRLCEYFNRYGSDVPRAAHPRRLAADLWTAYNHRLIPEVHPSLLNEEDENDVAYWKSHQPTNAR